MIEQIETLVKQGSIEQILKRRSTHKEPIKVLQITLYELGFAQELNWERFGADGDFGGGTTAAVKAFGQKNGVLTNGESVNKELAEKLIKQHKTVSDLRQIKSALDANALSKLKRKSNEKELVASLQNLLFSMGFGPELNWERFGADGDFGGSTANAVKAFASTEGIQSNGEEVDEILAAKILEKFVPFLGDGWAEAKAQKRHQRRRGKGQFFLLHPKGRRNFKQIEKNRKKLAAEKYIFPQKTGEPKLPRHKRKSENRQYKYEFIKGQSEIAGERLKMEFYEVKKFNKSGKQIMSFSYPEDHPENKTKDRVILHFTAGQTLGDIKTLTQEDYHVSTAYILGRDGTIYRMFSPKAWSYHLGAGKYQNDAKGIGIEISNYGPLTKKGDTLTFGSGSKYCDLDDTSAYLKLDKPFLGHDYYAAYTDQQYEGLIILLRYLTKTFNIPRKFLDSDANLEARGEWRKSPRYTVFKDKAEADRFKGICTHVNYRESGKWDLGPAFDWEKVIEGVMADEYKPSFITRTRGMLSSPPMRTEEEMTAASRGLDHGNTDISIYGPDGPEVDI
ncbi:MAG: N-acetylmuramoyl-L-alanine amidase [Bacteroidota bacterium]